MDEKENLNSENKPITIISNADSQAGPLGSSEVELKIINEDILTPKIPKEDISMEREKTILDLNEELSKISITEENTFSEIPEKIEEKFNYSLKDSTEPVVNEKTKSQNDLQENLNSEKVLITPADDSTFQAISLNPVDINPKTTNNIPPFETPKQNIETPIIPELQNKPKKIEEVPLEKEAVTKTPEIEKKEEIVKKSFVPKIKKPEKKEAKKKKPIAIRTYRNDLAEVIKRKNVSLTSAFISEENKKEVKSKKLFPSIKKSSRIKIYLSLLSLFLVVSGVVSVYLVYYYKPTPIIKVDNIEVKSYIFSEYQKEIFLETLNPVKLTKSIQNELDDINLPIGSLLHLYLTKRHQGEDGLVGKSILSTDELSYLLNFRTSEILNRFIEPDFMYGYYSSIENYPFLILKTRSFDSTFPEMLAWEKTLIEDLRPLFIEDKTSLSLSDLQKGNFEFKDVVINNQDTRAILNNSGEIIFIYTFVNKDTIVFTTNKIALQEIFNRLTITYRER